MDAAALPSLPTDSALAALMREALREAEKAAAEEELPIGAVVVIDGVIVARGHARQRQLRSQLAHAELQALLAAGEALWREFDRAILITTVEPCPMCLCAAVMADVPHVVFAAHDAATHSGQTVASNPYVRRHIKTYRGGALEAEARALIARFAPEMLSRS
jgi:tRNA(adenine34) deaminase